MIVYYSSITNAVYDTPKSVLLSFIEYKSLSSFEAGKALLKCPAFTDILYNTYTICSPFDYTVNWNGLNFSSNTYDEEFFDYNVLIRDKEEKGFFSILFPYPVFFAEKDLEMSLLPSFFHDTDISRELITIPGRYNIGRHMRKLEAPFFCKKPCTINIKENDPLFYLKFHTKEKITFKRFVFTPELIDLINSVLRRREYTKKVKPLQFFYDLATNSGFRKKYLSIIKNNLLD